MRRRGERPSLRVVNPSSFAGEPEEGHSRAGGNPGGGGWMPGRAPLARHDEGGGAVRRPAPTVTEGEVRRSAAPY